MLVATAGGVYANVLIGSVHAIRVYASRV